VMKEVCDEKYQVITPAVIDPRRRCQGLCYSDYLFPLSEHFPLLRRERTPNQLQPLQLVCCVEQSQSHTFHDWQQHPTPSASVAASYRQVWAIFFAGTAVIGAIARANLTHTRWSGNGCSSFWKQSPTLANDGRDVSKSVGHHRRGGRTPLHPPDTRGRATIQQHCGING